MRFDALLAEQPHHRRLDQPFDKLSQPVAQWASLIIHRPNAPVGYPGLFFQQPVGVLKLAVGVLLRFQDVTQQGPHFC